MKLVVPAHHLFQRPAAKGDVLHGKILLKTHQILLRALFTYLCDDSGFQRGAQKACLLHKVIINERNGGFLLRHNLHQLYLFKLGQGLADGGAGDGESGRKLIFTDLTAGRQFQLNNILF